MGDTIDRLQPIVICLVRHGETVWNREQRLQGHQDIPLTDKGREQARAVARRLSTEPWDLVYSSDLSRARETAEIIAKHCGVRVVTDPRLRERFYGRFEGLTREEIAQLSPGFGHRAWENEEQGVEPWERMADRSQEVIEELAAAHPGSRLILVSHGGWIRALLCRLFPDWDPGTPIHNTSVTLLSRERGQWSLRMANDTAHLQPQGE